MKIDYKIATVIFTFLSFCGVSLAQEFGQPPLEVQNVTASAGDKRISLSWDMGEDPDGVVVGYKIYYGTQSVQTAEDSYADEITLANMTSYTLNNLVNGTEYFFTVTALDDEENESETYAVEVSATPIDPNDHLPKISGVTQLSNTEILITMSEPVESENPSEAFLFVEKDGSADVTISSVTISAEQVLLTIPENSLFQGKIYQIVATSSVEDLEGNPVSSGITDTIEFIARYFTPPPPPPVEEEVMTEPEETTPTFNPELVPEEASSAIDAEEFQEVKKIEEEFTGPIIPDGWEVSEESGMVQAAKAPDEIPPLDVSDLEMDSSLLEEQGLVFLQWVLAPDLDGDIADQILYTKKGLGNWDDGYSLGKDLTELELEVDLDQNYEVRIVTIDTSNNESAGVSLTFSTTLTQTGPTGIGSVIALIVIFFTGLLWLGKRRAF